MCGLGGLQQLSLEQFDSTRKRVRGLRGWLDHPPPISDFQCCAKPELRDVLRSLSFFFQNRMAHRTDTQQQKDAVKASLPPTQLINCDEP